MAETTIGSTIVIDGEIRGSDNLVVQGRVKGIIDLEQNLLIEGDGLVEGEIRALEVDVAGTVKGNILARRKCQLRSGGKMIGDIRSQRILIADGAIFKGKVEMDVPGDMG